MQVTVLGCAGTYPSAVSGCSSYLVRHDGFSLLLDAGHNAVGAMQRHIGIFDLDAVYLSHLHADHCVDLAAYSYPRRYHPSPPPSRLPVWGPPGAMPRIAQVFHQPPPDMLETVYDFYDTQAGRLEIGPYTLDLAPTAHPVETYAVRVSAGGSSLTYSADTGPCDAVVDLARDSDLFLCEASYQNGSDHPPDLHLTAAEAGEHATRAGVKRLVLTHTMGYLDGTRSVEEAAANFAGPLDLARVDATYDV